MYSSVNTGELLRQYGIRPSVQRVAVMDYLLAHRTHPTAEEIYEALAPQIPTLSKTTVYNTLSLLVERGAAAYIAIDPRRARFDGDTSVHGHFSVWSAALCTTYSSNNRLCCPNRKAVMRSLARRYITGESVPIAGTGVTTDTEPNQPK